MYTSLFCLYAWLLVLRSVTVLVSGFCLVSIVNTMKQPLGEQWMAATQWWRVAHGTGTWRAGDDAVHVTEARVVEVHVTEVTQVLGCECTWCRHQLPCTVQRVCIAMSYTGKLSRSGTATESISGANFKRKACYNQPS